LERAEENLLRWEEVALYVRASGEKMEAADKAAYRRAFLWWRRLKAASEK
jgi:hypothetical protein